jgi:hypothetical protein
MTDKFFLPICSPEEQGIPSNAVLSFLEDVERKRMEKENWELHSFMFIRHGHIVSKGWWQPYSQFLPHMLFSLSKSFTSTAVGLAVDEGLLSLDDSVISFFEEELPENMEQNLVSMCVKHLLSMSTGNASDTYGSIRSAKDGNWIGEFLKAPVEHTPGSHFVYNSGATYVLSAIIQKVSGQKLLDFLKPRLFEPLGIEGAAWESCPGGINTGGWGLSLKTEDIAKLGMLYLQKGMWEGNCILSSEWVENASSKHISNGNNENSDWEQGYGFQFWRCRNNFYRGDGAFGQFCVVMPEKDAVLVTTGAVDDMQVVLDMVWEHLLPAMSEAPLDYAESAFRSLQLKEQSLAVRMPYVSPNSRIIPEISGKRYILEENSLNINTIALNFNGNEGSVTICHDSEEYEIFFGIGRWQENSSIMPVYTSRIIAGGMGQINDSAPSQSYNTSSIAASGTWISDTEFMLTVRLIETPFIETIHFSFEDNKLEMISRINLSLGQIEEFKFQGYAES